MTLSPPFRRRPPRLATLFVAALALGACGSDATGPEFDASLEIDLAAMTRTASGLYYTDLTVGTGNGAKAGDVAQVRYSGWLPNGFLFDSGTFSYTVASGQVIPGFDEGVTGMKVGGKRRMVIPPELAYGNRSVGPIPANATLVFDVELTKLN